MKRSRSPAIRSRKLIVPEGTNVADVIIWDRVTKNYHWSGNYHFSANPNYVPAATNKLAAPITNFPPGTTTNLDQMIVPPQSQRTP